LHVAQPSERLADDDAPYGILGDVEHHVVDRVELLIGDVDDDGEPTIVGVRDEPPQGGRTPEGALHRDVSRDVLVADLGRVGGGQKLDRRDAEGGDAIQGRGATLGVHVRVELRLVDDQPGQGRGHELVVTEGFIIVASADGQDHGCHLLDGHVPNSDTRIRLLAT